MRDGESSPVSRETGSMTAFRKSGSPAAIESEAASLRWLAAATRDGGAPVVPLLATSPGHLETRRLHVTAATPAAAEVFGRRLASTHAAGAAWWGQGPPGLADSRLAELAHPIITTAAAAPGSWGEFFADLRIRPYLRLARDRGALSATEVRVVDAVLERLASGTFDAPQPGRCGAVARLHGDLWGGNVLWADDHPEAAGEVAGVLIDPAAHGGHAETDLAELALFGSPHLDRTLAAYGEVSPLAEGWRERVPLHQLHMLTVHAALFGGGYGRRTVAVARLFR